MTDTSTTSGITYRRPSFPGDDFFNGHRLGLLAPRVHPFDGAVEPLASRLVIRHQPRDRLAVTRDDDRLAALDLIEQFGKLGFRHRGLNLLHNILIG